MTHFMYRSDKCGGQTSVVVGQMSGQTNVGRAKLAAPLGLEDGLVGPNNGHFYAPKKNWLHF
jgi:hypothetical protein